MGKAKLNIPMCAALVLLFLTMISVHLTSGLYARYTATATGSDSARVAKFDVTGSGAGDVTVDCTQVDNTGEYIINVTSNSEVAVEYSIEVVFIDNINIDKVKITLDEKTGTWKDTSTLSFPIAWEMTPNSETNNTHELMFEVLDWTYISVDANNTPSVEKSFDFQVRINVEQVD